MPNFSNGTRSFCEAVAEATGELPRLCRRGFSDDVTLTLQLVQTNCTNQLCKTNLSSLLHPTLPVTAHGSHTIAGGGDTATAAQQVTNAAMLLLLLLLLLLLQLLFACWK